MFKKLLKIMKFCTIIRLALCQCGLLPLNSWAVTKEFFGFKPHYHTMCSKFGGGNPLRKGYVLYVKTH